MTDYEAVKTVIKNRIEYLEWKRDQLKDERRDIVSDPEMGRYCVEYSDVKRELSSTRSRLDEMKELLANLDDDVCDVLINEEEAAANLN